MRRTALAVMLLAGGQLFVAGAVLAHGSGAAIEVEPSTVTAGGTVTLAGENLEPNDERVLVLKGPDATLDLGTVTTDEMGAFSVQETIPGHLPSGVYEFQAIGDETLTVQLNVEGTAANGGSTPPTSEPPARNRSGVEVVLVLLASGAAAGVGLFLVWRAERLGRLIA
jgi:hypothetical protein